MNNATVLGACVTGILLFLSSLLVPIITRKANKANDAAESSQKSAQTAETFTKTARELVASVNERMAATQKQCDKCLGELAAEQRRNARVLDAIRDALLEIVPLLDPDAEVTRMLRAALRTISQARKEEP